MTWLRVWPFVGDWLRNGDFLTPPGPSPGGCWHDKIKLLLLVYILAISCILFCPNSGQGYQRQVLKCRNRYSSFFNFGKNLLYRCLLNGTCALHIDLLSVFRDESTGSFVDFSSERHCFDQARYATLNRACFNFFTAMNKGMLYLAKCWVALYDRARN